MMCIPPYVNSKHRRFPTVELSVEKSSLRCRERSVTHQTTNVKFDETGIEAPRKIARVITVKQAADSVCPFHRAHELAEPTKMPGQPRSLLPPYHAVVQKLMAGIHWNIIRERGESAMALAMYWPIPPANRHSSLSFDAMKNRRSITIASLGSTAKNGIANGSHRQ
jgi:hypothetical protein